jgi:hypothetical protein
MVNVSSLLVFGALFQYVCGFAKRAPDLRDAVALTKLPALWESKYLTSKEQTCRN